MLVFISSYWKISIKICLKHLWQHVILWTGNVTEGHSYAFNKISHKVILVTTCGSVLQCNSNFLKNNNIFKSAKCVVRQSYKKETWKQKQHSLSNLCYILMYIPCSCNISFPCFTVISLEFRKQSSSMACIHGNINPGCLNFPPPYKW